MSEDTKSYNVAMIGAGPASLYGAAKLASEGHNVVILNRDIKHGGLAEYGIYLNKYKMKRGLRKMFARILSDERVHYYGNVTVGNQGSLSLEDVQGLGFDATIVAVGAQGTKWLDLPGERAPGVYHAKDLVYHYNRLPPFSEQDFAIGSRVVVVGFGNVELDIVHWLVCEKKVEEVTLVARRGPAERACTPKELKLVSGAMDLDALREEFARVGENLTSLGQDVEAEFEAFTKYATEPLETESPTRLNARFLRSPARIEIDEETGHVTGLTCDITRMTPPRQEGGRPGVEKLGEQETIVCDTVVFAIGDSIEPSIGLPLEPKWKSTFATVPEPWEGNPDAPRYMVHDPERDEPVWGTFVVGWARKASDGLVGKARADAETGVKEVVAYLEGAFARGPEGEPVAIEALTARLEELLQERGISFVDYDAVKAIEAREALLAKEHGVQEYKFASNKEMLGLLLADVGESER